MTTHEGSNRFQSPTTEITAGSLYAHDRQLYVILSQYRYNPMRTNLDFVDIPYRSQEPLDYSGLRYRTLPFTPKAALRADSPILRPWKSRPTGLLPSIISYWTKPGEISKPKASCASGESGARSRSRSRSPGPGSRSQGAHSRSPSSKYSEAQAARRKPRLVPQRPCLRRWRPSRSNWNPFKNNSATSPPDKPARSRKGTGKGDRLKVVRPKVRV